MALTQAEIDALPESLEIVLKEPINIGGDPPIQYQQLVFREPTAGQIKEASRAGDALEQRTRLLAFSAGVPPLVIDKLPARQLNKALNFVDSFSQDPQQSGSDAT